MDCPEMFRSVQGGLILELRKASGILLGETEPIYIWL